MTTVRFLSLPPGVMLLVGMALLLPRSPLSAQEPNRHWLHSGVMPPGAIGAQRLLRSGPLSGYTQPALVQPTLITAGDQRRATELEQPLPTISVAAEGGFTAGHAGRLLVGLEVGRPYRFCVSGVPNYEETDVYPTIELVDRLHPPPGKELKFPVPVELTTDELQMAARGAFVTRVIYVEDPGKALPLEQKDGQSWIEVRPGDDPLLAAGRLGRPIAILRIGARGPGSNGFDPAFTFGSPRVRLFDGQLVEN